jgi:hypothetical protein|tara:strand:- start:16 stop:300 length:285 start_codon:yes stop_codon:yes gene_type:complete
MKNTILILSGLLILGACAPQNLARLSGGAPQEEISSGNFEYIGCHKISAGDDRWAMGLLGLKVKTTFNRVYFKQRKSDGTSSKLKLTPCKSILF